ncbi:MAG: hypothetical protein AAGA96_07935 [Verrucomicrobiota bacterium]
MKRLLITISFLLSFAANAQESIVVDAQEDWESHLTDSQSINVEEGVAQPNEETGSLQLSIKTEGDPRKLGSIVFKQWSHWDNWTQIDDITPTDQGLGNAYVFLPVAPGDYYVLAQKRGGDRGKSKEERAQQKSGGYHAWHSTDLETWTHHGPISNSKWVTTAEYADGKFYIYYDEPNDQDPHLVIDDNLKDGIVGEEKGEVFADPSHGSDIAIFRNIDGQFHIIYEDWSPLDAKAHSWDSPLAGHTSSEDGVTGFKAHEHPFPIDHRTEPTGEKGYYKHSSSPDPLEYDVHEPDQDAYGDYTMIRVGDQFHLFGDFHPAGKSKADMGICHFTSDDLYREFGFSGQIGSGFHPDPSVGFAEGKFYLVMQQKTDFVSPGPWVDGVEARAGVDTNGDGDADEWTEWQKVSESYSQRPGFARVVDVQPAALDTSSLPEGSTFLIEFKTQALENGSQPVMDRIELTF